VQREAIEQELEKAGWELDYGFSGHLLIGGAGDLSILVPWRDGHAAVAPQYELYDAHRNLACRVGMIPDPLRAQMLVEEHGEPASWTAEPEWDDVMEVA
jgi:hypothetical protein